MELSIMNKQNCIWFFNVSSTQKIKNLKIKSRLDFNFNKKFSRKCFMCEFFSCILVIFQLLKCVFNASMPSCIGKTLCFDTFSIKLGLKFYTTYENKKMHTTEKTIVTDIINGKTNLITKTYFSLYCFNPKNVENATNAKTMKNFFVQSN